MAPWWDLHPAALNDEISDLVHAGFQVRREVLPDGRLALQATRGSESYQICFFRRQNDRGDRLVVSMPSPEPTNSLEFSGLASEAVELLRRGVGTRADAAECVLVHARFGADIPGAGGTLGLARSRLLSSSYLLRSLTGSRADLVAADDHLLGAFPEETAGSWARGSVDGFLRLTAEDAVSAVEALVARAHGLAQEDVRNSRQVLGVVSELGALGARDAVEWRFVTRTTAGEARILSAHRLKWADQFGRAPFAGKLAGKRVTIIGCGAIGWSVALELARSGVSKFVLYDDDVVNAYNLPRLQTYLGGAGKIKSSVLAEQLRALAPAMEVGERRFELGTHVGMSTLVAEASDLIINVTGEEISTDETNAASIVLGKPAVFAWVSNGVYAGRILRVRPGVSACYDCVREAAPTPVRTVGPAPRGEMPWTGACFDTDLFACAVARLAVLTLVGNPVSEANPDHVVLDYAGVVPVAREVRIRRDPRCAWCG